MSQSIFEQGLPKTSANHVALSPLTFIERTASVYPDYPAVVYGELRRDWGTTWERSRRLASALSKRGIQPGETVAAMLPNVPAMFEAHFGVPLAGCVLNTLNIRLDAEAIAYMLEHGEAKAILVDPEFADVIEEAVATLGDKPLIIDVADPQFMADGRAIGELEYEALLAEGDPAHPYRLPEDEWQAISLNYTSGTTGKPKGVIRDTGGYAVALAYSMEAIYDIAPGDVFFSASDVGWVVGHSYIVYAPLLRGATSVVYEGKPVKTPDAGAFWRLINEYQVKSFFTAPTAFRAIKKEDPDGKFLEQYDISCMKALFLAGERLDPPTFHWLDDLLDVPVIDHWWQTETGWPIAANLHGLEPMPTKAGSATVPVPGFDVQILDREGERMAAMEQGSVVIKQPMPPGCLVGVWGDPQRFHAAYMAAFPGFYLTGDGGYVDEDGYLFIMGRTDDVINVAGHRLSTGEMEEVVGAHPAVAECAVIGIHDALKGQLPIGLVIPKDGFEGREEDLEKELVALVREKIGPIACFKEVLVVDRLPKTRSGKILRKLLRNIADGKEFGVPSTIDDPASLQDVHEAMKARSVGASGDARQV